LIARSVEAMFDEEFEASFTLASRLTDDRWNVPSLCPAPTDRRYVAINLHRRRSVVYAMNGSRQCAEQAICFEAARVPDELAQVVA
jgi:hypothetical protein